MRNLILIPFVLVILFMGYVLYLICGKFGLYLFAGPQFGFNVQSSLNADAVNFEGSGEDMDIKDIVKVFDFSIGIGAGYQFDMGLNVSLNYNIGLTNTFDYGDTTSEYLKEEFDKCRNSVLQINLGWRF